MHAEDQTDKLTDVEREALLQAAERASVFSVLHQIYESLWTSARDFYTREPASLSNDEGTHVDLIALDPLSAAGPRLIRRTQLDDPDIGKTTQEHGSAYVDVSDPHTMAECPFPASLPNPLDTAPDA